MNRTHLLLLSLVLSTSLISGCFSTKTSLSTLRMDRPEVSSNQLQITAKLGLGGRREVEFDLRDNKAVGKRADQFEPALFAGLGLVIVPKVEVSISSHDDARIGIKYQFHGEATDEAPDGNFSQALSFGLSRYSDEASFTSSTQFDGNTTQLREFDQDTNAYDIAWILGYRISKSQLIYGGPFYIYASLDGVQTTTLTTIVTDSVAQPSITIDNINLNSSGRILGANIAYEFMFKNGLFLSAEYVASQIEWEDASGVESTINMTVGFTF